MERIQVLAIAIAGLVLDGRYDSEGRNIKFPYRYQGSLAIQKKCPDGLSTNEPTLLQIHRTQTMSHRDILAMAIDKTRLELKKAILNPDQVSRAPGKRKTNIRKEHPIILLPNHISINDFNPSVLTIDYPSVNLENTSVVAVAYSLSIVARMISLRTTGRQE